MSRLMKFALMGVCLFLLAYGLAKRNPPLRGDCPQEASQKDTRT
jgi:hypothetical protein